MDKGITVVIFLGNKLFKYLRSCFCSQHKQVLRIKFSCHAMKSSFFYGVPVFVNRRNRLSELLRCIFCHKCGSFNVFFVYLIIICIWCIKVSYPSYIINGSPTVVIFGRNGLFELFWSMFGNYFKNFFVFIRKMYGSIPSLILH